jgi:quercetin dioxygenase-like cupin family protein
VVPEAKLEQTEAGLVPATPGWFVLNVREARWIDRGGRGHSAPLTGWTDEEAETLFPQLGMQIAAVDQGQPLSMYHWETEQEDFLILAGDGILLVEGQERPLRQWDFVHCPPEAAHTIVGGDNGCVVLAVGSRENQASGPWGAYTVDEAAIRHGAGVEEETQEPIVAYARFARSQPTRYGGWLPGD